MEAMLFTIMFMGVFILISILLASVIWNIIDKYEQMKTNRFNEAYPQFVKFQEEYEKMIGELCGFNTYDARKQIDRCTEQMKYYPSDSNKYVELENKIIECQNTVIRLEEGYKNKEKEIKEYVNNNWKAIETVKEKYPEQYKEYAMRYRDEQSIETK